MKAQGLGVTGIAKAFGIVWCLKPTGPDRWRDNVPASGIEP
jgi:hypothetical protein